MDSDAPPGDSGTDGATMVVPASSDCTSPTVVSLSASHIDLVTTFDTDAGAATIAPSCAAGAVSAEVFYQLRFSEKVYVYADTFGSSLDTVLFLLSPATSANCTPITTSTTPGDAVCSDNACGTMQSQMVAVLNPGNYVLGVGVEGSASGTLTTHLQYAAAPSGAETALPQGSSMQKGQTIGSTGNIQNQSPSCVAAGPENGYWWVNCPGDPGGMLTASTCGGGTTWESVLATEIPGNPAGGYACAVDSCLPGTSLGATIAAGAGFRALIIDGETVGASGSYTMNVTRP